MVKKSVRQSSCPRRISIIRLVCVRATSQKTFLFFMVAPLVRVSTPVVPDPWHGARSSYTKNYTLGKHKVDSKDQRMGALTLKDSEATLLICDYSELKDRRFARHERMSHESV
jgi:hypothetical protein